MKYSEIVRNALGRSSVCIGLDPDIKKIPECVREKKNALFEFNRAIIDATLDYSGSYHLNFAFYESFGPDGWRILRETVKYIRQQTHNALIIADAKRGDIGNTAEQYAKAIFYELDFDSVTINPYMGHDSVEPFICNPEKGAFILCLTSNPGSRDFQYVTDGKTTLYERVVQKTVEWSQHKNCGLVVGATHPDEMKKIRTIAGDMPFLIPGIGAQGGNLESAVRMNYSGGIVNAMINVSRSVIYASGGKDFADATGKEAQRLSETIKSITLTMKNNSD